MSARSPRGRRGAVSLGVLTACVATLLSAGALHPTPAAAATAATRPDAATADFLARVKPQGKERVSAAVLDLDGTGREATVYGDDTPYDTASIVKVDILAAALLQGQDAKHGLTEKERADAEVMIERSDNDAANHLWRTIGRAKGLDAANKRLGLTETKGGPDAKWGLTRTTARDQIRLLRAVYDTGTAAHAAATPLDEASRTYIRTLMGGVVDEQSWGVSAAAGSGSALKNGWLQRNTTELWDVNSVGRITAGGHHYLVAVLSDGSKSMKDGVALVERAARAAVASAAAR
ncbi:serine hydrolase [Streptomyces sp. NPDC050625]|uniref:serine hydrolase n=1 Tax=Streptomyces sp. NPDC050625 TaxID=3154629 RepID=UPI00344A5415